MDTYNKALNILMKSPVTDDMIQFLTHATLQVMPNNTAYPSPPGSPKKSRLPSLRTFITKLVRYTNVYTPTLLSAVCYLNKLKRILPKDAKGLPSTIHRLFLACLIISAKFHNDSTPLNKHWAKYTDGLFSLEDINLMERQLLQLLKWDLRLSNEDLILDLQYLLEPIKQHIEITTRQKKKMLAFKKQQQKQEVYKHMRNLSVSSNLSSSTLVNSTSYEDLKCPSPYNNKSTSRSSSNGSIKQIDIWHDNNMPNDLSWNLENHPVAIASHNY
ncbi:similar to Saccharomyces cerevisiae YNL289W PCL1 Cyclin, interacts with cyclin-dependent kinase Pho85p [Maudiozyma barnettii]|uniref:Similar to Saccharomyces cerevisiae YNL289W PCL1 Cyclin, interacts with cyclin-dependent kinase Pho85p n=1 Tax=Maudiozyma barnettii TaxID=61262 RepID=A0A8H2ZJQ7_9SACH|nr:uncharacterized protein KABA2_11S03322 [Kazachstania barnettii]CAB4256787.1 similar to Saccharomyces cerevisiae YNL289W PCL1 Cyclin, interacts with cyclin-dependent kinase Pho85p [Kazachstania barnettii]CAD1785440.1 similar to Saccharomyces cerevisiae YNL289W PCL1 Cyclin, interacts with cyclin-dependent kinase Pho85p [Kazachstania barnettii]